MPLQFSFSLLKTNDTSTRFTHTIYRFSKGESLLRARESLFRRQFYRLHSPCMSYTQPLCVDCIAMYSICTRCVILIHDSCIRITPACMSYTLTVYMTYTDIYIDYTINVIDIHDRFFKEKRRFLLFTAK